MNNLRRWQSDDDVVAFFPKTTLATSAFKLQDICNSLLLKSKG